MMMMVVVGVRARAAVNRCCPVRSFFALASLSLVLSVSHTHTHLLWMRSMCGSRFDAKVRLPKALPCTHNVCGICIQRMALPIVCPVCKQPHPQISNVAKLAVNQMVL